MQRTRADQPHRQPEPHIESEDRLEYRIICNAEHFIVVNPVKRVKKREKATEPRRKGMLLREGSVR